MPLRRLSTLLPRQGEYAGPGAMSSLVTFYTQGNALASTQRSAFGDAWIALYSLAGDEIDKAQQILQKATHVGFINYQMGILDSMTFDLHELGGTRTFQITTIVGVDEQRRQLKIYCFEINQNAGAAS
jgi:head-tail adaptor